MRDLSKSRDALNGIVGARTDFRSAPHIRDASHSIHSDWSDKVDRPLRFPHGFMQGGSMKRGAIEDPHRTRWLVANDVYTQFLDAGIGCCWFAAKGDEEPVVGETEEGAIRKLARDKGLTLWPEA